jgi:hypothetical protein
VRGAEQGGNNSPESKKKLLGLEIPEGVAITGGAAFVAIVTGVAIYEYKKLQDKSSQASGTEPKTTKKKKRQS